jgi:hypothetical protein
MNVEHVVHLCGKAIHESFRSEQHGHNPVRLETTHNGMLDALVVNFRCEGCCYEGRTAVTDRMIDAFGAGALLAQHLAREIVGALRGAPPTWRERKMEHPRVKPFEFSAVHREYKIDPKDFEDILRDTEEHVPDRVDLKDAWKRRVAQMNKERIFATALPVAPPEPEKPEEFTPKPRFHFIRRES